MGSLLRQSVPERVGTAFKLLMQVRMFITAITLVLLPRAELTVATFLLVISVAGFSWLAASHWDRIVPLMLEHPLLLALDICVSFAVLRLGGTSGPFLLSTVVTAGVAGLLYRWAGAVAGAGLQILCYYITLGITLDEGAASDPTFQAVLGQPIYYPLVGFAGAALRRLFDDQAAQETARRRAEVIAAAAEERTRMAREMHDSLAKTLRGIALAAAALPAWVSRDQARALAEAERIAAAAEIASREARGLITGLRADSVTRPLPEAVREAVDRWGAENGIVVRYEAEIRAELPLRSRYEVMGILAETLTNVERHADARSVDVRLVEQFGSVLFVISDDGRGFTVKELPAFARAGHYGLVGLHERAERIGGSVTVASEPGKGTTVTARIPVRDDDVYFAEVS